MYLKDYHKNDIFSQGKTEDPELNVENAQTDVASLAILDASAYMETR